MLWIQSSLVSESSFVNMFTVLYFQPDLALVMLEDCKRSHLRTGVVQEPNISPVFLAMGSLLRSGLNFI